MNRKGIIGMSVSREGTDKMFVNRQGTGGRIQVFLP